MKGFNAIKTAFCVITLTVVSSCASTPVVSSIGSTVIRPPMSQSAVSQKDKALVSKIMERNTLVEDQQDWIEESYEGLKIRRLNNVSEREYKNYKQYLDEGKVYILVHPAYYSFFHRKRRFSTEKKDGTFYKKNIVERFISKKPKDLVTSVMQAQERRSRDFIEYKSTEGKLLILILPKNYARFKGYAYRKDRDEFMRYLNEVTNMSKSVLFVESRSARRGYLYEEEMLRLMEFLVNIDAKTVLVGGGYVGRCLEDFYMDFVEEYGMDGVYVVPELADISPRELSRKLAKRLMLKDGSIDTVIATRNLSMGVYGAQEIRPRVMNLP